MAPSDTLTTRAARPQPRPIPATLAAAARERLLLTLLLTAAAAMAISAHRSRLETGVSAPAFWASKIALNAQADIVAGGDSRIVSGLSPAAMQPVLGETVRAANFAFNGLGYSDAYLDDLRNVLAPDAAAPAIILGITPASLCDDRAAENEYTLWREKNAVDLAMARWLGPVRQRFDRCRPAEALALIRGRRSLPTPRYERRRLADGSNRLRHVPMSPTAAVGEYRQMIDAGQRVSPERVETLLRHVRRWRSQGVRVYALRPPVSPQVAAAEGELGLDYDAFIERFTAAGGVWIDIPAERFDTTDGSHLRAGQVERFSKLAARRIAADRAAAGSR